MAIPFTRTKPNENRTPEFVELPDGRKRLTRFFDLAPGDKIIDGLVEPYGTADTGDTSAPTAGFANLYLVDQRLQKDDTKRGNESVYVKVYEELHATAEVQIGGDTTGNTKILLEDGRTAIEANFLQLAAGTYTPGTVGTTTAPGDTSAFLQKAEMTHDGTLRRIKRTYVYAGQIQQTDDTRNNGALLLRTLVYVKTEPSTPSGYTLIATKADPVNGIPVYTYTFAKGTGEISRDIDYSQSSDQGTTGVTRTTIRYLVVPAATVQPTSLAGSVEIGRSVQELDGHRIWTTIWAKGAGQVLDESSLSNAGKLVLYHRIKLGSAPSTPSATIAGTVTLIASSTREAEGHTVYDYRWAEGTGEISRDIDYTQSSDQGTTGITRTTIRYLVAPSATVLPTSLSGSVEIGRTYTEGEGHRIWTTTWAKGTGQVVDESSLSNAGKLVLYHRIKLGGAPSTPSATIAGTVTLIASSTREAEGHTVYDYRWAEGIGEISRDIDYTQSSDQGTTGITRTTIRYLVAPAGTVLPTSLSDSVEIGRTYTEGEGHRIWTTTWAKGAGQVVDESSRSNGGKLVLYHRIKLGSAPSTPSATIAGTVTLIASSTREAEGHTVYDYRWAEGIGIIGERSQTRDGGLLLLNRDILVAPGATDISAYTANGILVEKSYTELEGHRRWSATWMQKHDGTDPTSGTAVSTQAWIPFTYPGRAKYYSVAFSTGGYTSHACKDVFLSPPVQSLVLATTDITYQTTNTVGSLPYTLWNPTEWATLRARWIAWANSPRSKVEGLRGYIAVNSGASGTSGGSGLDTSVLGDRVYASTDWEISLSGGPSDPGGSTWTLSAAVDPTPAFIGYDGTKYYRLTLVIATPAAQPSLPV